MDGIAPMTQPSPTAPKAAVHHLARIYACALAWFGEQVSLHRLGSAPSAPARRLGR